MSKWNLIRFLLLFPCAWAISDGGANGAMQANSLKSFIVLWKAFVLLSPGFLRQATWRHPNQGV
jgi:hypothetical protein